MYNFHANVIDLRFNFRLKSLLSIRATTDAPKEQYFDHHKKIHHYSMTRPGSDNHSVSATSVFISFYAIFNTDEVIAWSVNILRPGTHMHCPPKAYMPKAYHVRPYSLLMSRLMCFLPK